MIRRIAEDLFTWLNLVGNTMPRDTQISQTMMMTRRKMTTRRTKTASPRLSESPTKTNRRPRVLV